MNIVFFGTPAFSVPFLSALHNDPSINVLGVVCQPDKPVGRKQELTAPAVKQKALELNIPVFQFDSLRKPEAIETLKTLKADVFVLVVYGKFLPDEMLNLAPFGVVNVHPSLLPKYRGPSPMKTALLNGETETGISIMLLDSGMDTGPLLAQTGLTIDSRETNTTLEEKVCMLGPEFLLKTLKGYVNGSVQPQPQNHSEATVTKILEREDGRINWHQTAHQIDCQIRAFEPWPGTWTTWQDARLKLVKAHPSQEPSTNQPVGTVLMREEKLLVQTGKDLIELEQVQLEGKQVQSIYEFVRGHADMIHSVLN